MICPNIKSAEWKLLVDKIGETNAYREFYSYGYIPSADNYDIVEPVFETENKEQVKPGVEELFNENPELANQVYEALGFKQKNQIDELGLPDDLPPFGDNYYEYIPYRENKLNGYDIDRLNKIVEILDESTDQELYTLIKSKLASSDKYKDDSKFLSSRDFYSWLGDIKTRGIRKDIEEYKQGNRFKGKDVLSAITNTAFSEYIDLLINIKKPVAKKEITPQQKQQAIQLYSQYLDTIFPDSKVKDIVYHGSPNGKNILKNTDFKFKFIDEEMSNIELNGVYFTQNKETAESYSNGVYTYTDKTNKAVLPSLLNVKNPKYTRSIDDISLIDNEKFKELKSNNYDAFYTDMESDDYLKAHKKDYITEIAVFEPEQIHILSSKADIEGFKNFVGGKTNTTEKKDVLYSIKTKSLEDLSKGINPELLRSSDEIKYSGFIKTMVLFNLGDLGPGKKLKMSPEQAFNESKKTFVGIQNKLAGILNDFITSEEDYQAIKSLDVYSEMVNKFDLLKYINSYEDLKKALTIYTNIVEKFDRYVDFVKLDLARNGLRIVKNKIENVIVTDNTNNEEDQSEDSAEISQKEIGERYDKNVFETNPRDTASIRVKALIQTIYTGKTEFGIPIYANPNDVFADILEVGSEIDLTNFTADNTKLTQFLSGLAIRAEQRKYLNNLIDKINKYVETNDFAKINDILTVASKSYAVETLLLYKLVKVGSEVFGVKDSKIISTNRDSVDLQISKEWLEQHKQSDFYRKDALNNLFPKQEKLDELKNIIEEGLNKSDVDQQKKFQEFFNVLGINFTDNEIKFIYKKLPKTLKKAGFNVLFQKKNLLENILESFTKNIETPFIGQYGFQDESTSMKKIAKIYYEANPAKYKITSTKTADGKSKYSYILPSYLEQIKREFSNGNLVVTNSALAKTASDFWNKVVRNQSTFELDYFNGIREQKGSQKGKIRKSLTPKDQIVTMFLQHQQNLNVGTYIAFTLSDKTTGMETRMTKEFFVDSETNPVGYKSDYNIVDDKIVYTSKLKRKIYNELVAPEVSRIISSMNNKSKINVENYDIASKLFYFLPNLNRNENLQEFRNDLYSGNFDLQQLANKYSELVGEAVLNELRTDVEKQIDELISLGIIKKDDRNNYTYPLFINGYNNNDYVNRFRQTAAKGRDMARLMVLDMKLNYLNSQIKTIQFLKFDPALNFKTKIKLQDKNISDLSSEEKVSIANSTWDEFSKRAAALIAPGTQGNWFWNRSNGKAYNDAGQDYITITSEDVKTTVKNINGDVLNKSEITDAQEFVTLQEHIDYLMSEGKIDLDSWESIYNKIKPGEYYELSEEEIKIVMSPVKPVYVYYSKIGDDASGLNRIDYVKSSRYPLIPQHEAGSERDKLRAWMEKNSVRSVNFASAKKLGRPSKSLKLFDENNNFIEPSKEDFEASKQLLSRSGIRNQQEVPEQKDEIATVTQMNRTLFDGLLNVKTFTFGNMSNVSGETGKKLKEAVRSKLFDIHANRLREELGNLNKTHENIYRLLKNVILNDTTGSYSEADLQAIELDPTTKKFKIPLEAQWALPKFQSLINSLINKNVMLKVEGTSFIQVSGVGAKYNFSKISKGVKSGIIWIDKYSDEFAKEDAKLKYIRQENGKTKAAQVIVSQYLRDEDGNLIDLSKYITEDKYGRKILNTSSFSEKMFQLIGTRIPNQSHPSTLPIEVVGFLPSYMENSIVVPDGITGQMGSDFDVDKLYAYISKFNYVDNKFNDVTYNLESIKDVANFTEDQLNQLYRDIHWEVLMNSATFSKITKSIDMPEVGDKVEMRKKQLEKYKLVEDITVNLPLDFMTSINRYIDNRSGKVGVGVFANLISAQADFQDKVMSLADAEDTPNPLQIKLSKDGEIIDLLYIGKLGESTSFIDKKRSISDNLNIMFTESVDNAKNQYLREFNWTEKAMSAVGFFAMLSDAKGQAAPIEFMMDLASQPAIVKLFELTEQKQDSFGAYDFNALINSSSEIQNTIIQTIDKEKYLPSGKTAESYFDVNNKERNSVIDAETLAETWIIGKAIAQKAGVEIFEQLAKDFKYDSVKDMMLTYYNTQYNAIDTFIRLENLGRELMIILGVVYPYTKGIGPNVFATKQKLYQLNKLSFTTNFSGINNIAGEIAKNDFTGDMEIDPVGEIGSAIANSLIFAQNDVYKQLFPISSGRHLESIVDVVLNFMGVDKSKLSKNSYETYYNTVFNSITSYIYTSPSFELFDNVILEREKLINGKTSIGFRTIELKQNPKYAKNGFLKNIDVEKDYSSETYTISFKAPFGQDIDVREVMSGFYELALDDSDEIKQLAKDFALYPYVTGDAGFIGRYIPIGYYNSDPEFNNAMKNFEKIYSDHISNDKSKLILIDQMVQNYPDTFSKSFNFTTRHTERGISDSTFKKVFKNIIKKESLKDVSNFTLKLADFPENDVKLKGIRQSLQVPLSDADSTYIRDKKLINIGFKYPAYILLSDEVVSDIPGVYNQFTSYLYKRTSDIATEDGSATYERVEILGYKNISEFDFNNPDLVSSIPMNNVNRNETTESEIEKPIAPAPITTQEGILNPADYTNHSGGAALSDTEWDQIGREFGVIEHKHYREPLEYIDTKGQAAKGSKTLDSKKLQTAGIKPTYIEQKDYNEGAQKATQAFRMMFTDAGNKSVRSAYIIRNWMQVKNADAIYALGTIKQPGENASDKAGETRIAAVPIVKGGTGYAVQMAINEGKPVYVFDGTKEGWYTYDYKVKNFVPTETPKLTKNFAGIGSRTLATEEVINKSLQAIRDVYENTFKSAQPTATTEVKPGVEISSNATGLAAALTNPTELAKSKGNLTQSYPVEFQGKTYKDAEAAYQALKSTATKDEGPNSTYNLMVNIITAKLQQHPRLVDEITNQGGSEWILNSTHQPTKQNSVWETGGNNWFIKSLNEAYENVTSVETTEPVKTYQGKIESLQPNQIFVFGSNPQGRHGAGAAQQAKNKFGAVQFVGRGLKNQSYALVTKNLTAGFVEKQTGIKYEKAGEKSLTPEQIQSNIKELYDFAKQNPDKEFLVAYRVDGKKNLNGYTDQDMADMFSAFPIPDNIVFEEEFSKLLSIKTTKPTQETEEEVIEEQPEVKSSVVEYGGKNYIIEGTMEDGYNVYFQAQGEKGQPVSDANLLSKVILTHEVNLHPDWVVTLTNIQNQPKYFVDLEGSIRSLQKTSFGDVIQSEDITKRVMSLYNDKSEIEVPVILTEETRPTPVIEETLAKPEKRINVPKGSNPNNNVIMETDDTIYLMNDGQQEAFNFIKNKVEELLANKKQIKAENLDETVIFTSPLTKQFNGLIPVDMWNNMIGLAGRGGVGKTTVIKAIMAAIEGKSKYTQPSIMYLAPTHTASTVLQESLGLDSEYANDGTVNTIAAHTRRNRMVDGILSLASEKEYINSTQFKPSMGRPDIIIVDESSMIGKKDISDMILRLKQDLNNGLISRLPVFIFMGDYRQLGPIGEQQSSDVNKGVISSTLLLDKNKTKELTQVMRSDNEQLHKMYDSIGNQIIKNINNLQSGAAVQKLSFENYDKLTNQSTENMLVVTNENGVIDDYTDYLINNNNPYGMFWVHYNNVEHANTKNIATKIRNEYFRKLEIDSSTPAHRLYTNQDYIIFDGKVEISTSDYEYTPSDNKIEKILSQQKYRVQDGKYKITKGAIKPGARFKVLDVFSNFENIENYVSPALMRYFNKGTKVEVEHTIVYNRQNRVRHIHKILGFEISGERNPKTGEFTYGKYNPITKQQEGIEIKNNKTGEIIAKFNLKYGDYIKLKSELDELNERFTPPYVPSYIGSSHTAQGNSIKNVIVGDYNIKRNLAANVNQDDIFSSMYVALTRTSGRLIIIKPAGSNIVNNQEVFLGAITDTNNSAPLNKSSELKSDIVEIEEEQEIEILDFDDIFLKGLVANQIEEATTNIFGVDKKANTKTALNNLYKDAEPFYKEILSLVSKTGGVGNLQIIIDETLANPGTYNKFEKIIKVNPKLAFESDPENINALQDVIMHELMHHLTVNIIEMDKSKLTPEQRKWVMALENLFKTTQERILKDPKHAENLRNAINEVNKEDGVLSVKDKSFYYGLTNINEFASMLMTDKEFRSFMNNTPYSEEKSLLERFIDIFAKLLEALGITVKDEMVLKEGIKNIIGIVSSRSVEETSTTEELKSISTTKSFLENLIDLDSNKLVNYLDIKRKCK
jgi:hypothetical protein